MLSWSYRKRKEDQMSTTTRNPYSYDCEVQEVPSCNTTETRFVFSLDSWICEDCQDFLAD